MEKNKNYFVKGEFILRDQLPQTIFRNSFTRYVSYWIKNVIVKLVLFCKKKISRSKRRYNYNVSACLIFKNEAKFLCEWISYHSTIGIDHFYLYNNNSTDNFREILQPFIDSGKVDLVDWPFEHAQMSAYKDCYDKHRNDTQWLTFIDADEFICPVASDDLKSWLKNFKHIPGIAIYWKQFGSQGLLKHHNPMLVIEQYTQCWSKLSVFTKMFCNMDFEINEFDNPHHIYARIGMFKIPPVNQYGKLISFGVNRLGKLQNIPIQINHYWGKAYDVFLENKVNRSDVYHANDAELSNIRRELLRSHENMCTTRDYTIHRSLLITKLKMRGQI